jgi:hypothetical protein
MKSRFQGLPSNPSTKVVGRKPFQGRRKFRSIVLQRFQAWKKVVEERPM